MLSEGSSSPPPSSPWLGQGQQALKPEGVSRTPFSWDRNRSKCGDIPSPSWSEGDVAVRDVRLRRRLRRLAGLRLAEDVPEPLVQVVHSLLCERLSAQPVDRPILSRLFLEHAVLALGEELHACKIVRTVEVGVE